MSKALPGRSTRVHVVPALLERHGGAHETVSNRFVAPQDFVHASPRAERLLAERPGRSLRELIVQPRRERIEVRAHSIWQQMFRRRQSGAELAQDPEPQLIFEYRSGLRICALVDELEPPIAELVEPFDEPIPVRDLTRNVTWT